MSKIGPAYRFQTKITLVIIAVVLVVLGISDFCVYRFYSDAQFNALRQRLKAIAQTAALGINTDQLQAIPLSREGVMTPAFKIIAQKLMFIKDANPQVAFVYIMTKTGHPGVWQFVVDPWPTQRQDEGITSFPGDTYNASRYPEMLKGYEEPSADEKLELDQWGITLSGYAPIRDARGEAVAVLGVDMMAQDVYLLQAEVERRLLLVAVLGVLLAVIIGIWLGRAISRPVGQLVEGTRRIGAGDLDYQVNIQSQDEIGELAQSFNLMAGNLKGARAKILNYFYDVVKSFVMILEARDHYTRGHSESVANYSEKIALKMGFPVKTAEMIKRVALLHDIGKMGIKDSILHKVGKLTDEEWSEIKKHPELGENILRPILGDDMMLTIVRNHHERADGKGYPDGLNAQQLHMFAAIVAVADAYDAMTSNRAYRPAMSKEQAIEQLKLNRGLQFHPKVVDVFLEILKEK